MKKLLIVDDTEFNRDLLQEFLEEQYDVILAEDGEQAVEMIGKYAGELSTILLDIVMPKMSGIDVLAWINDNGYADKIPVLIISGENDAPTRRLCFEYGVFDYIQKPFDGLLVQQRVKNAIDAFDYRHNLEAMVAEQTAELHAKNERLKEINGEIIELLGSMVEARNMESGNHIKRVKTFSGVIGKTYIRLFPEDGVTRHDIDLITEASPLHDIGKIMIKDNVLLKPGRFTPEEFDYMKTHTTRGVEILENAQGIWDTEHYQFAMDICHYHHERWDGKGYPEGIVGEEIPLSAQIVALADVYDALTSERVYKPPFTPAQAFRMIRGGECGSFNPKILDVLTECREELEKVFES